MLCVDVGSINDSYVIRGQRVCILDVLGCARMVVRALMDSMGKIQIGPGLDRSPSWSLLGVEARLAHSNYVKKKR